MRPSVVVLAALAVFSLLPSARAGHQVGNGGGAWVCREASGEIRHLELVDLFEARTEYYLAVPRTGETRDVQFARALAKIRAVHPFFAIRLDPFVKDVLGRWPSEGASDLERIDDSLYRRKPGREWCLGGEIAYGQVVNFTFQRTILVDFRLYSRLNPTDQAALLLHEAVYAMFRLYLDAKDSLYARKIVGHVFSNLESADYAALFAIEPYAQPAYVAPDMETRAIGAPADAAYEIRFPRHADSGWPVGSDGKLDGLCRALGYVESLPDSVRFRIGEWRPVLFFDPSGAAREIAEGFPVERVGCRFPRPPLTIESSIVLRDPRPPGGARPYPRSASGETICRDHGFDAFVKGGMTRAKRGREEIVAEIVCLRKRRASPF